MSKSTVTRLFVGGVVAVVGGIILGFVALIVGFTGSAVVMSGPVIAAIDGSHFAWATVGILSLGILSIIGGSIAGLVAWIGALMNTANLDDKTWFIVLLVLGIAGLGVIPMFAYVISGPREARQPADRSAQGASVGPAHA